MSRVKKGPKQPFFQGADFRPLQKKIENEMPIFSLFLPGCILSEVSKNLNFSSVHPFLALSFHFTEKKLYQKKANYYRIY